MTIAGWIFMLGSVSAVVSLTAWCYYKVFTLPPERPEPPPGQAGEK